jgi:CRISPR-associated protein Cas6
MFWNEEKEQPAEFVVPDDVVDLAFRIHCPTLPLDHAHALSTQVLGVLPWLADEPYAGLHLIHGAASGNGWYRPEATANQLLHLSRRTRMRLRIPSQRLEEARRLTGTTLDIQGHALNVGEAEVFLLSNLSTLFSRYVIADPEADEDTFLQVCARELQSLGIPARKMLGGISHTLQFPDGPVHTRSLMVAELEPEHSVLLQQAGLGDGRAFGCGLFLPHKGIKPVGDSRS